MRIDRLQHLITILENVPPVKFDLGHWRCGTVHCACGWAALDPQFNEQGFLATMAGTPRLRVPDDTLTGWEAVEVFFELRPDQAEQLFDDNEYGGYEDDEGVYIPSGATAAHVIARIRAMIATQLQLQLDDDVRHAVEDIEQCMIDAPGDDDAA